MLNKSFKFLTSLVITTTLCISSVYAAPEISLDYDLKQSKYFNDDDGGVIILCAPYPLCKERIKFNNDEKITPATIQAEKNNVKIPFAK